MSGKRNKYYKFWQEGNHAIELYNEKFVWKINYIRNNPVEAGFIKQAQEWMYSFANNYQELESIIEVKRLTQKLITYS